MLGKKSCVDTTGQQVLLREKEVMVTIMSLLSFNAISIATCKVQYFAIKEAITFT